MGCNRNLKTVSFNFQRNPFYSISEKKDASQVPKMMMMEAHKTFFSFLPFLFSFPLRHLYSAGKMMLDEAKK